MDSLVPGINKKNILGIEAPLWSETVSNMKEIEYMMIPRMLGYAEMGGHNLHRGIGKIIRFVWVVNVHVLN